ESGDDRMIEIVTSNLGFLNLVEGRYDDAQALLADAYDRALRLGRPAGTAVVLENLAFLALSRDDAGAARRYVRECLELFAPLHSDAALFETLLLAAVIVDRDDPRRGIRLHSAGRALAAERGYELSAPELELADEALGR